MHQRVLRALAHFLHLVNGNLTYYTTYTEFKSLTNLKLLRLKTMKLIKNSVRFPPFDVKLTTTFYFLFFSNLGISLSSNQIKHWFTTSQTWLWYMEQGLYINNTKNTTSFKRYPIILLVMKNNYQNQHTLFSTYVKI